MAKVKCKKCGTECCTCNGCNPSTYVNGLCPRCQKLEKNAESPNYRVSGLSEFEESSTIGRMQPSELSEK